VFAISNKHSAFGEYRRRLWHGSNADFFRYLQTAFGSASELEYHLLLSRDLQILENEVYVEVEATLLEIKRMLATLIAKVRSER
jgi:four helix bundle protein